MHKYDNRCSMCLAGQENCAMLEKKCNRLLYVFNYTLSGRKTAGTSVRLFKDAMFSGHCGSGFSVVLGKGRSLFYKVVRFTLRKFWWVSFIFSIKLCFSIIYYYVLYFLSVENNWPEWLQKLNVCQVLFFHVLWHFRCRMKYNLWSLYFWTYFKNFHQRRCD